MNTPEARYINTPEQGEYWGGFFGAVLRPSITREVRNSKDSSVHVYYKPRLQVFDRKEGKLLYIQKNFEGNVRPQSESHTTPDEMGFVRGKGFKWVLGRTGSIVALLQELEPFVVAQQELVRAMIEFSSAKQERLERYSGGITEGMNELSEEREEVEAEFTERLNRARNNRDQVRLPLTPANVAGILDASGVIAIARNNRPARGYTDYRGKVHITSDNTQLLEAVSAVYGGLVLPVRYGSPPVYSDSRYYWVTDKVGEVKKVIEDTLPSLVVQRRQAELVQGFMASQGDIILRNSLRKSSLPSLNLAAILKEGFYSEVYRLNHE